jgi:crossover junction endodeoxyribonuclease RuvC
LAKETIILGIDPGTTIMGYGIILVRDKEASLISMGHLDLSKYSDQGYKLQKIFQRTRELVEEHLPDEFAVEAPFFGKNVQSMLKLGRAQGVAMAAALSRDVPIREYSPRGIKRSITGNGNASKEQVAGMLASILRIEELPKELDATDGTAVALCHYFQAYSKGGEKKKGGYSDWKAYLKKNPKRKL